jgi:eukaryotic-like serine/threonine-protein kinase
LPRKHSLMEMEDDRLVQLALSRGHVTQEQVDRAKAEQKTLADRGVDHGVYFLLQDLGFLSEEAARDLRKSVSSSAIRALEVDGFVIQGRLGSGGMGDVFRSTHADGRIAAVKLLSGKLARTEEYVRRFLREARAMQRLEHPHIVGVFGSGESLGTRYILMELVDGPSLKTWLIDKGRFDPGHAVVLLRQMAQALGYAWDHGVLHRDVKPANILVGPPRPGADEPFCAKLCDFGLARLGPDAGEADLSHGGLTGSGLALGTPHYMSPEQASGEHDVDQRADIYGLGATIYHALLGQTLYSGKSSAVIMYKQVTESVDLQLLRTAGVAEPLVALLGRMLEKRRHARIATWAEVLAAAVALSPAPTLGASAQAHESASAASAADESPDAPLPSPATDEPSAVRSSSPLRLVLVTTGVIALLVCMLVGIMLSSRHATVVDPNGLAFALSGLAGDTSAVRDITLLPGSYAGPIRLGAAHRGVRLRAAGPGVEITGAAGSPALICDPGLNDAVVAGMSFIGGSGAVAVEAVGGCVLRLEDVALHGGLNIGGGVLVAERITVDGTISLADRGSLELQSSRCKGAIHVERADLRLIHSGIRGPVTVRSGSATVHDSRISSEHGAAFTVERSLVSIRELFLSSPDVGLAARAAEAIEVLGLSIDGSGPSIIWEGDRLPAWRWERFDLHGAVQGLPGPLPAGPGADLTRLPDTRP